MSELDRPILLPGAIQIQGQKTGGKPSQRRRRDDPSKLSVHTSETPAGTGKTVVRNLKWPYSVVADPKTREILQVLPLNFTAYSLRGTHAETGKKIETNHSGRMHPQVCIVGYSERSQELTQAELKWLAEEVFGPILHLCAIPNRWRKTHGEGEIGVLASAKSRARLTLAECHAATGVLGHQHWYGNDHWDPGKLDVSTISKHVAKYLLGRSDSVPSRGHEEISAVRDRLRAVREVAQRRRARVVALTAENENLRRKIQTAQEALR